ncbi:phosphate acyltransferase PlsX [Mycoplasma sp. 128]|uniref:phosphate acyltransferase PlsX n=1 Tax=Mycoplasma sp. 3341 TaxID=3447506 RepID=UPI003F65CD84
MKKIVFDILNNDNGSLEALKAANSFANANPQFKLVLFGDETILKQLNKPLATNIEFHHSPILLEKSDNLRDVIKKPSSMLDAINYLNNSDAQALLSSGDSGSYLAMAMLKIKRLPNVSRPAFMPMIPKAIDGHWLLLDVGANLDTKPEYLTQWASVSSEFSKVLFNNNKVRVGILNIGSEDYKGPQWAKEANQQIKTLEKLNYEYVGFVEPKDLFKDICDVVIVDGYAGNMVLKTMETSFLTFGRLLKKEITKNFFTKIGALILRKPFYKIKEKFDYRNVGSAFIVGLDKIVLKSHGASDEKAFLGALNQIKLALENDVVNKIKQTMEQNE